MKNPFAPLTEIRKHATELCVFGVLILIGVLSGCSLVGANPKPPTKTEGLFFNTITNYVNVTNQVPVAVAVYHTNEVVFVHTNEQNQVVTTVSNVVNQVWVTNTIPQVVTVPQYVNTVKPEVSTDLGTIGGILNTFFPGAGAIGVQAILALLGGWAYLRSSKQGDTSTALAQEIESIRQFIKTLPSGQQYDSELVKFLQEHQNEAGVAQQVAAILQNRISNPDAKAAAQGVIDALNALKAITTPLPPVSSSKA